VQFRFSGVVLSSKTPVSGNPDNIALYWMSAGVMNDKTERNTTITEAVELKNKRIWLKVRKGKKAAAVADIKVALFEYLCRPVTCWQWASKEIISNACIARIGVLILLGSHVKDLPAQGQRVHRSEDGRNGTGSKSVVSSCFAS